MQKIEHIVNAWSILDLSLPVILHHGQVFSQVFQADLELGVLCAGEVKELSHQQVCLVSDLGCLPGVGGQEGAGPTQVLLCMFHRLLHALHLNIPAGTNQNNWQQDMFYSHILGISYLVNILAKTLTSC